MSLLPPSPLLDETIAPESVSAGAGAVPKSLYDANTILKADSDDTPTALTMGASTILARLATGGIVAATPAELVALLGLGVPTVHAVGAVGEPAFVNSWVNFGSTFAPAAFWKDAFGVVHLEGFIKNGSPAVSTVFTLPVGFRPAADHVIATATSSGVFGEIQITSAGVLSVLVGSATWVSLSGARWRAA